MLILQNVGYHHANKKCLFGNISLSIQRHQKAALIGNNGSGKSTLLKLMAGILRPSAGSVFASGNVYYVPQHFGQYNELTIAEALKVASKLNALKEILSGQAHETNLTLLDDDWNLEERCQQALAAWGLPGIDLAQTMNSLSGGQKTKVFIAGIAIHRPDIILMDEPGNHLDGQARKQLYGMLRDSAQTIIVVSHDRKLLNLFDTIYELNRNSINRYGGNYDFYLEQKQLESIALDNDIRNTEKTLRKAKEVERETMERQQRLDARGKKKQEKAGLPTISMKTLKNKAERSTARTKEIHAGKTGMILDELNRLRNELLLSDKMKLGFDHSHLHKGRVLFAASNINYHYGNKPLWQEALNFIIASGERIAIAGANGSGKTSLVKLLLGELEPGSGSIQRTEVYALYIDQEYSLITHELTVYDQAQQFNKTALQEHEVKLRLNRFLFTKEDWDKPCSALSGGEKMRLLLCCLNVMNKAPDLIILDEPTNNLDIQNTEILTGAVNDYKGTLLVISHDEYFLEQVSIEKVIAL